MGTSKTRESVFRFKRFDVANSLSAMKVGTDGVLLGAWACVPDASRTTVLDVGTGSGLIALMLAQRFDNAFITGIDIVEEACEEARVNAAASPWARRIVIEHAGFCEYAGRGVSFDTVVSNPPFFKTEIKAADRGRMLARHGADLDYRVIMRACAEGLLSADGILSMVSPAERQNDIMFDMELCGLRLSRMTRVFTKPGAHTPSRMLWEMRRDKKASPPIVEDLLIGSDAYKALTGDFYL
ncbi:methyltransferase domain-containing protein [Muribaculaceae bacterium Isolate-042 (Harlan)]|uniref:tRNA1(Val) (adenine(37)-N6)-methyltransferase n=1 Tax=Muribaculum intestinale TaxID=1796646 RepID=UPI000F488886|nr:methyltransferase [Muribaculum intestinale]ROS79296.1 methyltransferase domain-containing protein [Muribaculaceae bacterium Isolate-042 (Harlan)]TGX86052.1 methyltransferase domain-containing protein [Muribaculum intestinale]